MASVSATESVPAPVPPAKKYTFVGGHSGYALLKECEARSQVFCAHWAALPVCDTILGIFLLNVELTSLRVRAESDTLQTSREEQAAFLVAFAAITGDRIKRVCDAPPSSSPDVHRVLALELALLLNCWALLHRVLQPRARLYLETAALYAADTENAVDCDDAVRDADATVSSVRDTDATVSRRTKRRRRLE